MAYYNSSKVDSVDLINKYLEELDWQVKQDANVSYSFPGLMNYLAEDLIKRYSLIHLLPPKAAQAHNDGDIYIHDLGKNIVGYCSGWDLRRILKEGLTGIPDKTSAGPAKHFQTAIDHAARFILIVCNEWAGAQALSSIDTLLAPFIFYDNLTFKAIKSGIQSFMYNLGISTRYGGQVPFSNITLDWTVPEDLKDEPVIIGGKTIDRTYGEFQREMDLFNKALIEVYMEGDYLGQPFSFPIPTYNITKDFDWDSPNADLLFEMTAKYGNPYFQNFVNSDLKPTDVRAMCCRLQMDMTQLVKKTGGHWATGASTGSVGVVDINIPRIAYTSKGSEKTFFKEVDKNMDIAKDVLEHKRKIIQENLERGLIPYTKRYLGSFDRHFSTIGLIGVNEAIENMFSENIASEKGRKFALKILNHMKDRLVKFQKETDNLYNLEATPNESASYMLAKKDREKFSKIKTAGNGTPYYTNSTYLPVGYTDDVFEALDLQEELQSAYTGGTVFHVFMGERLANAQECKALVKKISHNYKLPYFSITPTFSVCPDHGYIKGEAPKCPNKDKNGRTCKQKPLVYSRVVGYYRPVQQWNKGKSQEFKERKTYKC
ncbi:ribonucleoside triphosphate reductase [Candidatus Dojkabacteria bacterium]|nr:ribonucleoside triphosphate reductase [Candidatus Dojkabacteria bacterium]